MYALPLPGLVSVTNRCRADSVTFCDPYVTNLTISELTYDPHEFLITNDP